MFDSKDVLSAGGVLLGVAAVAALGFAAGYLAGRDPQRLRRWSQAAAGGLERMQTALSETREELADLWAEARADARATHPLRQSSKRRRPRHASARRAARRAQPQGAPSPGQERRSTGVRARLEGYNR
jgi:hypothetical protein